MTTPARDVFKEYARQRRAAPLPGFACQPQPDRMRYTPLLPGGEGIVLFSTLVAAELDDAVSAEIAHFGALGRDFEWKVYDFDQPPDLAARLLQRGFQPGEREAFMVYPTASHRSRPLPRGVRLEQVTAGDAVRTIVRLQEEIWRRPLPGLAPSLTAGLAAKFVLLAFVGDTPVGTGWLDLEPASDFADLHGGAVLPAFRGRGVYSALFDVRAEEARRRGFRYLAVDAAPMSRPILLRQGFQFVCETTPFLHSSVAPAPAR